MTDLRQKIMRVVAAASNGRVSEQNLNDANGDLVAAGMASIDIIGVIEGLEAEFALVIDMNQDPAFLANVDSIAAFVEAQGSAEAAQ
ncbi:MAG: hypothetical protein ACXIVD_13700 [Salinarimonas sp.]